MINNQPPDLTVTKTNDTGGSGAVGVPFKWILSLRNVGLADASFGGDEPVLFDGLPPGPIYDSFSIIRKGATL
ncbi:MAG: hypothetical protein R3E79_56360 [Caldilineaceae bacterium]